MVWLLLLSRLADLATIGLVLATKPWAFGAELNPLMVRAYEAYGFAGLASVEAAFTALLAALLARVGHWHRARWPVYALLALSFAGALSNLRGLALL